MVKLVKFKDITNEELVTKEEGLPIGYACYNNNTLVGFCTLQKISRNLSIDL